MKQKISFLYRCIIKLVLLGHCLFSVHLGCKIKYEKKINLKIEIMKKKEKTLEESILDTLNNLHDMHMHTKMTRESNRFKKQRRKLSKNTLPSKTIQGDAISIGDLLIKHRAGIMPAIQKDGQYSENPSHEDLDMEKIIHADFTEKETASNSQKKKMEDITKQLQKQEVEKANKANEKRKKMEDEALQRFEN